MAEFNVKERILLINYVLRVAIERKNTRFSADFRPNLLLKCYTYA